MFSFLLILVSFCFVFLLFSFLQMFSLLIAFVYFTVSRLFVLLPRVLRIWESAFYSQVFFTLHSFPAFVIASLGLQFSLQGERGSHWRLKHGPSPSVSLKHSVFFMDIISTESYLNLSNYIDKLLEAKSLMTFTHIN